jgi:hypothetical protein
MSMKKPVEAAAVTGAKQQERRRRDQRIVLKVQFTVCVKLMKMHSA